MKQRKNDVIKRELARASKSVDEIAETMVRVKDCKSVYVMESVVRRVEYGHTVVKRSTTYHTTRKSAFDYMVVQYEDIVGKPLVGRDNFTRYVSDDETLVATFEIYKPMVG